MGDVVVVEFKQDAAHVDERGRCEYTAGRTYSMSTDEAARFVSAGQAVPVRVLSTSGDQGHGRRAGDTLNGNDAHVLEKLAALAPKPKPEDEPSAPAPEAQPAPEAHGEAVRSEASDHAAHPHH